MLNQNTRFETDTKGYLTDFDTWSEDYAIELANEHGLGLTECHWLVIGFLRDYWTEYALAPDPRQIINKLSKQMNPAAPCTRAHLESLFGDGGCELACKIAGLQNCHCRSA